MIVTAATADHAEEIAALVNSAYRGDSSRFGWTTEADYLEGSRIDAESTRQLIEPRSGKNILVLREEPGQPLLGCVYLERSKDGTGCYLGMLTVSPKLQNRGLGRILLGEAEKFARAAGAYHMTLGVIHLRGTLMAWYERRGYNRTAITKPFPYDQPEVGTPKRDDLCFIMFEKNL